MIGMIGRIYFGLVAWAMILLSAGAVFDAFRGIEHSGILYLLWIPGIALWGQVWESKSSDWKLINWFKKGER